MANNKEKSLWDHLNEIDISVIKLKGLLTILLPSWQYGKVLENKKETKEVKDAIIPQHVINSQFKVKDHGDDFLKWIKTWFFNNPEKILAGVKGLRACIGHLGKENKDILMKAIKEIIGSEKDVKSRSFFEDIQNRLQNLIDREKQSRK